MFMFSVCVIVSIQSVAGEQIHILIFIHSILVCLLWNVFSLSLNIFMNMLHVSQRNTELRGSKPKMASCRGQETCCWDSLFLASLFDLLTCSGIKVLQVAYFIFGISEETHFCCGSMAGVSWKMCAPPLVPPTISLFAATSLRDHVTRPLRWPLVEFSLGSISCWALVLSADRQRHAAGRRGFKHEISLTVNENA